MESHIVLTTKVTMNKAVHSMTVILERDNQLQRFVASCKIS